MRLRTLAAQWATVAALLALLAAIAYWRPEWLSPEISTRTTQDHPAGGAYHAIDGDSFSLGQTEVRLHGIDAPEYRQTCRSADRMAHPCGKMARDQLSRLIRSGEVKCRVLTNDRYGRQVSECSVGPTDINREMVRLGWAVAYRKHSRTFIPAEAEAKAARRGIWQWQFETPETYRNRSRAFEGNMGGVFKDE